MLLFFIVKAYIEADCQHKCMYLYKSVSVYIRYIYKSEFALCCQIWPMMTTYSKQRGCSFCIFVAQK